MVERGGQQLRLSPISQAPSGSVTFPLDHPYIELVYVAVLGPSGVVLLRRAGFLFARDPDGVTVDATELARDIGVRSSSDRPLGKQATLRRALDRLVRAKLAEWLGPEHVGIRTSVPPLSSKALQRLPGSIRELHEALVSGAEGSVDD